MSTEADPQAVEEAIERDADAREHGSAHGFSDRQYVQVALILALLTAMEVYASYADWMGAGFIPLLIFLMTIKFFSVVLFFMHLKFDSPIFSWLFYAGLGLAVTVYVVTLFTFKFFNS